MDTFTIVGINMQKIEVEGTFLGCLKDGSQAQFAVTNEDGSYGITELSTGLRVGSVYKSGNEAIYRGRKKLSEFSAQYLDDIIKKSVEKGGVVNERR